MECVIIRMRNIWMEKIVEWVIIRMWVLEWTIQKHLFPSILIQDTKIHSNSWCDWWTIWMEKLNCWNKHSFQKTIWMKNLELLKQTPIQMDFPFQWNGMGEPNGLNTFHNFYLNTHIQIDEPNGAIFLRVLIILRVVIVYAPL